MKRFFDWFEKRKEYQRIQDFLCGVRMQDSKLELYLEQPLIIGYMIEYLAVEKMRKVLPPAAPWRPGEYFRVLVEEIRLADAVVEVK